MSDLKPSEIALVKATMVLICRTVPGVRVWRQNTGALYDREGRLVRYGVVGSADISGIASPDGWRIEIEIKRPGKLSTQTDKQRNWQRMVEEHGGIYILADNPNDAAASLSARLEERRTRGRNER